MLLATDGKLFISAWYTSGFRRTLAGLNEAGRQWGAVNELRFGGPFIIPERGAQILVARSVQKGVCSRKGQGMRHIRHREYESERRSGCGRAKRKRNGRDERTRGSEGWSRALEETKGVFSCRRRIQMERSGLFSSRSTYLPLCPRSPRINVTRHAAKNRMADPREYICCRSTLKRRSRENVQLASRACMRRTWN